MAHGGALVTNLHPPDLIWLTITAHSVTNDVHRLY
jgi:hypothetical protein